MSQKLLYVGCGHHRMAGFIHVEISIGKSKSGPPDILADITDHIPIEDNSVDLIYSRATLEHLTYRELVNHLLECRRILKPGGCVRAVLPNFDMIIKEYNKKLYWDDLEKHPDLPNENYVDTYIFRTLYFDHFYLHNFNTLSRVLQKTGFIGVEERDPGDSKIKAANDELFKSEISRFGEIILEAVKSEKEPVAAKRYPLIYPMHPIKKVLAKYFNIGIIPFIKRRPIFPQKSWFEEKTLHFKKNYFDIENVKSHQTGSHGKILSKPRHENKLDLDIKA